MHKIFCYFHNVYCHKTYMILIIKSVVPYAPCICLTGLNFCYYYLSSIQWPFFEDLYNSSEQDTHGPFSQHFKYRAAWKMENYISKKDSGIFPDFLTELTLLYIRHEKMFFSAGIPNQSKSQTEKKEKSFFKFFASLGSSCTLWMMRLKE